MTSEDPPFSLPLLSIVSSFPFIPLELIFTFFLSIFSLLTMGKFRSMVDTPERLAEFRRKYNFPDDVEVSYCLKSKAILLKGEDRAVIPLVAIVEGRVRIPMSDLLTNFLRHFKVCLDQCIANVFRIISSVDILNKRLKLNLTEHDINYVYSFQDKNLWGFKIPTRKQKETI